MSRPQTHDLLATVIETLGGAIERVTVTGLHDRTFYAELTLRLADGSSVGIDCRPSDAIALGVAVDAPIYVEESVIENATRDEA